ncbi:MAG: hypothetical protein GY783_09995, partial [Gammaproteobacteria bacterium]|nr:hypothetical protein [Gammaproteobacteria bacterium]
MTLGKKTLGLFMVLGFSICLGSYLALRLSVLPPFEEFERESTRDALSRVMLSLNSDLHALEIMNVEYSLWDDTYEFARGELPEYEADNLDPVNWHSININMMLIFDAEGRQLYARLGHPSDGHVLPLEDEFQTLFAPGHPLVSHKTKSSSVMGLLNARTGLIQVVSYPILTSAGEGQIAGALVVGQFLNDEREAELGQRATVDLSIHSRSDTGLPPHAVTAFRNIKERGTDTVIVTYPDSMRGLQVLYDLFGEAVALLEVRQPRNISQIGANTIRTTMLFLAAGSVGFLLAALFFTQKLIVAPIRGLTEKILNIQHTGNLDIDI